MKAKVLFLILESVLFIGFFYSASFYFKKKKDVFNPKQALIQLLGTLIIVRSVYLTVTSEFVIEIYSGISLVILLYSVFLFYWTFLTVRKITLNFAHSDSMPQEIIRLGPFRYLRHPFYASYSSAWISMCILTGDLLIALSAIVIIYLYMAAAKREEEEFAKGSLANQYAEYRRQSKIIIPKIL